LQSAVENIKNLKMVCNKLLSSHRQLQEDYVSVLEENEKLKKTPSSSGSKSLTNVNASSSSPAIGIKSDNSSQNCTEEKEDTRKKPQLAPAFSPNQMRLPDLSFLYEGFGSSQQRNFSPQLDSKQTTTPTAVPYGQDSAILVESAKGDASRENTPITTADEDQTIKD